MKYIFSAFVLCSLVVSAVGARAQDAVSKEYDEDIQKMIDRVESKTDGPSFSNTYEPKTDLEKKVNERLEKYCVALANENWRTVYDMMIKGYRDVVSFNKFLGQKRLTLYKITIDEVKFKEDSCALAEGYYGGEQGGSGLDSLKIPLRIYIMLEEGEWRVFKNPYENSMGIVLPNARKFKIPCDF